MREREKVPQEEHTRRMKVFCLVFDIVWLRRQFVVLFGCFSLYCHTGAMKSESAVCECFGLKLLHIAIGTRRLRTSKGVQMIRYHFRLNFVFHHSKVIPAITQFH